MLWRLVAWIVSRKPIADWIIRRAVRTPYTHLPGYMERYWLFNPYSDEGKERRYPWCPISIRVHFILRADEGRHLHDHPWNARTIILRGGYVEQRGCGEWRYQREYWRGRGDTVSLRIGEFHRISDTFGPVTLFITGCYRDTWGFKIPHKEYLGK